MGSEYDDLMAAIRAAPDDDHPRLVAADWFGRAGLPRRAEFVRLQLSIALQHRLSGGIYGETEQYEDDARRERELFCGSGPLWWDDLPGAHRCTVSSDVSIETACGLKYFVRRGFVSSVRCSLPSWKKNGPLLVTSQPVTRVTTDRDPYSHNDKRFGWWRLLPVGSGSFELDTLYHLPPEVWLLLEGYDMPGSVSYWKYYQSSESAGDALSAALLKSATYDPPLADPPPPRA